MEASIWKTVPNDVGSNLGLEPTTACPAATLAWVLHYKGLFTTSLWSSETCPYAYRLTGRRGICLLGEVKSIMYQICRVLITRRLLGETDCLLHTEYCNLLLEFQALQSFQVLYIVSR